MPTRVRCGASAGDPAAVGWIAWPRKAAGHDSDISENGLRELVLPTGLVDIKVAALDEDWSGLKFVWRKELRARLRSERGERLRDGV